MAERFIPVNLPDVSGEKEREYLLECVESGWISSEGPYVAQFEEAVAKRVNREHGIAVTSGSAALDVAVAALGISEGDEVILPSFTIISCAASIAQAGAKPVPIESDPLTWNMDVSQIEAAITPRTKAIMAVHIYGLPVDMDPLMALAKKHGLYVIEDAAEMLGQTYKDIPCGSFGDLSIFSFYPNKHITTGEGGMVLTNNPDLAERAKSLRNLCFQPQQRFVHEELGWNYRITNLQAALGLAQMERLDEFVTRKREMGALYNALLKDIPGIILPCPQTDYAENIYWVYGIMLHDDVPFDAESIRQKLADHGIGTRPFFYPMHQQPVFHKKGWYENLSLPVSEKLSMRGFYLPSGLGQTKEDFETSAHAVKTIMKEVM